MKSQRVLRAITTLRGVAALWLLDAFCLGGCATERAPALRPGPVLQVHAQDGSSPAAGEGEAPMVRSPEDSEAASCAKGEKEACAALAYRCHIGAPAPDVPWESAACAERERRACDLGEMRYCANLADRYSDVTSNVGVAKDEAKALELNERVCNTSVAWDRCMAVALAYETGRGVAANDVLAVRYFERACPDDSGLQPQACVLLARHVAAGTGTTKNEARAVHLLVEGCAQGVCEIDLLQRLCADAGGTSGSREGCVALARVAGLHVAWVPQQSLRRAIRLLELACARREAAGCEVLAEWYGEGMTTMWEEQVPRDPRRSAAFRKKACDAGAKGSCSTR